MVAKRLQRALPNDRRKTFEASVGRRYNDSDAQA